MIVVGGEALVDLVDEDGLLTPVAGGGPFNTAIALGRLEIPVAYLGTLSHDAYGSSSAGRPPRRRSQSSTGRTAARTRTPFSWRVRR